MGEKPVLQGLGSIFYADGVAFRIWAPLDQQVSVIGTFNDRDGSTHPTNPEEMGYWYADVEGANEGDHYNYQLITQDGVIKRINPNAREVTNSVGNAIVDDLR